MKLVSLVALSALSAGACTHRNGNLEVRYSGVVLITGGALMIIEPSFNGDGFDKKLDGAAAAIIAAGAALVIGSILKLPEVRANEAIDDELLRKYNNNLKAVELLHQAEAAAGKGDCDTIVVLAPQIDAFDPGVGDVLRKNVAAARCLKAPPTENPVPDTTAAPVPS